jgi:predicted phage terminase large subunit-like protein
MTGDQFSCHYLLDPVSKESQKFKKEFFSELADKDFNSVRTFILIDPAGDPTSERSEKKDSDYVGIIVVGVNSVFDIIIRNMFMGRVNPTEAIEVALSFLLRYNPYVIGIERAGMGNMRHYLTEELRKRGRFAVVEDLLPNGRSKYSRIVELEPLARRRKIYIAAESQHKEDFYDQITKVTNGIKAKHDDLIDPLAYILDMLKMYGIGAVDEKDDNFIPPELAQLDPISKEYWMSVRKAKEKKKDEKWASEFASY